MIHPWEGMKEHEGSQDVPFRNRQVEPQPPGLEVEFAVESGSVEHLEPELQDLFRGGIAWRLHELEALFRLKDRLQQESSSDPPPAPDQGCET